MCRSLPAMVSRTLACRARSAAFSNINDVRAYNHLNNLKHEQMRGRENNRMIDRKGNMCVSTCKVKKLVRPLHVAAQQ